MEAEAAVVDRISEPAFDEPWINSLMVFEMAFFPPLPKEEEVERRRSRWDTLAKRIDELVAELNACNVETISYQLRDLDDLIVGPGLVCKTLLRCQMEVPELTSVFVTTVAVVNSKFPMVGKILSRRIIFYLRQVFIRRQLHPDTDEIMNVTMFLAHLIKQRVVRLAAALELLCVLLEDPLDQNAHIARRFVAECGASIRTLTTSNIYLKCIGMNRIVHGGVLAKKILRLAKEFGTIIIVNAKGPSSSGVKAKFQYTHCTSIYNTVVHPFSEFDTFSTSFFTVGGSIR